MRTLLLVAVMLAMPIVFFRVGIRIMTGLSGAPEGGEVDSKPLNQRWGYSAEDASRYWREIESEQGTAGLERELRLLKLDLAFPLLYGGALAASLLIGWTLVGRSFSPLWFVMPVVVGMVADWVENLNQIRQLRRFMAGDELSAAALQLASAATRVKLGALGVCAAAVVFLSVWAIRVARSPAP